MIGAVLKYLASLTYPLLPWRDQAPETAKYPLAVLTVVSMTPDQSAINEGGSIEASLQIDCYAKTLAAVKEQAGKYVAAMDRPGDPPTLNGWDCLYMRLEGISWSSEQESDGNDARIYRITLEVSVVAEQSAVNNN